MEQSLEKDSKDGHFYADLKLWPLTQTGYAVHLKWSSKYQQSGHYEVGMRTIHVCAVDEWGVISAWEDRTIELVMVLLVLHYRKINNVIISSGNPPGT